MHKVFFKIGGKRIIQIYMRSITVNQEEVTNQHEINGIIFLFKTYFLTSVLK